MIPDLNSWHLARQDACPGHDYASDGRYRTAQAMDTESFSKWMTDGVCGLTDDRRQAR